MAGCCGGAKVFVVAADGCTAAADVHRAEAAGVLIQLLYQILLEDEGLAAAIPVEVGRMNWLLMVSRDVAWYPRFLAVTGGVMKTLLHNGKTQWADSLHMTVAMMLQNLLAC
jgi:hypothetical protein